MQRSFNCEVDLTEAGGDTNENALTATHCL